MKEIDFNDEEDFYVESCLRERFEYGEYDYEEKEPECGVKRKGRNKGPEEKQEELE